MSRVLSKSKLMAFRQCPRRLWLEVHRPELLADSQAAQTRFDAGHEVGDVEGTAGFSDVVQVG